MTAPHFQARSVLLNFCDLHVDLHEVLCLSCGKGLRKERSWDLAVCLAMSYLSCLPMFVCQAASRNWTRQASPDTDVTPVGRTVDFQQLKAFARALNGFHAVCAMCFETFRKCKVQRPQFFGRNWNVAMASVKARLE